MTKAPLERALVRKGNKALEVAKLALEIGDHDSAVSRSYYAMLDIAQAALLRAGVSVDQLPRTHNGLIEAFRRHAVHSGKIYRQLATELSRAESLRIRADYTGTEIESSEAQEVVRSAELFVQTVERVFGLDKPASAGDYQSSDPRDDGKVSEPAPSLEPISLEEIRRQARENWLRLRQQRVTPERGTDPFKDADRSVDPYRGHSIDEDLDE